MIDPISLSVIAYLGLAAVVFVAVTLDELYSWFRNRNAISGKQQGHHRVHPGAAN